MGFFSFLFDTKPKEYDAQFKKDIHKYDRDSYRNDLKEREKDKKVRAIWGLEGMGDSGNIRDLERIANDSREDEWVRKEAKIAVKNLKKKCSR